MEMANADGRMGIAGRLTMKPSPWCGEGLECLKN